MSASFYYSDTYHLADISKLTIFTGSIIDQVFIGKQ
jgi:hypothetical protein